MQTAKYLSVEKVQTCRPVAFLSGMNLTKLEKLTFNSICTRSMTLQIRLSFFVSKERTNVYVEHNQKHNIRKQITSQLTNTQTKFFSY